LLAGVDPLAARAAERANAAAEALRSVTFRQCAERYMAANRAGWKNPKHAAQWDSTIATYVDPIIGDLPVQAIDTTAVMRVLEQEAGKPPTPFWQARPDTAGRVRGRIEAVLSWGGRARGYRTGDNPARWRGHIDRLLPALSKLRKVEHHAALPYQELPAFLATLRARDGAAVRALEFTILTATRTGEVIGARRAEFDDDARMWVIPGIRMKSGREHRVPLSDRAIEILANMPSEGEFVFPGRRPGALCPTWRCWKRSSKWDAAT
jgi:integrase